MGEGSDFAQRVHQAFLMKVMNEEALRTAAAAASGGSNAVAAAAAYTNAAAAAAATAGGYNSQHWAAMLGMYNGMANNRNAASTPTPTTVPSSLASTAATFTNLHSSVSPRPSSPQDTSASPALHASSAMGYPAKSSLLPSPSMVPIGHSNIPTIGSPQNGIVGGIYEPASMRVAGGRGRGSGGRKIQPLVGENGRQYVKCDMCGKCLADPSSLYRHRKIHSGEKPHTCRFCGRKFIQR